jgi:hypothetical protein
MKFANAYAFAALDCVFTILWFAAAIAVAVYNANGISQGAKKAKVSDGNCSTSAWGDESSCKLSKATVGLGVVILYVFPLESISQKDR